MNLKELHTDKEVSAKPVSQALKSKVISIQILKNGILKEHLTKEPALLVCVSGEVEYEDERGSSVPLRSGDFHEIEPLVKHWVKGIEDSQLILAL